MNLSGIPTKFTIPWAQNAGASYINTIPNTSEIGVNAGYASFPDGLVPLNATPIASGGVPPRIQDLNGIWNIITLWQQWYQAGGPIRYDSSFQSAVGGYPKWSIVMSAVTGGLLWISTTDANMTNPDSGGAGWQPLLGLNSPSSLTANGWKKYPDENSPTGYFIEQWGGITTSTGGGVSFIFPIAFPTAFLTAQASYSYTGAGGAFLGQCNPSAATTSQIPVSGFNASGSYASIGVTVWAKGY